MQRLGKTYLAALAVLLSPMVANADLIEVDFASAGDGLLILDTGTNREWIDVAKTTGMSVNDFLNSSIFAGAGFTLATAADVNALYSNAGASTIDPNGTQTWHTGNNSAALFLAGLMEHSSPYSQTNGNSWIHGYLDFGSATNLTLSRFNGFSRSGEGSFGVNTNGTNWRYSTRHRSVGVWAYRNTAAVPEPGTLALFGLGLAGIGFAKRRKA